MINKNTLIEKFSKVDSSTMSLMSPFTVCKDKKTLYLHIAKTGGSTIVKILRENGLDDRVLSNKKKNWDVKRPYFEDIVNNWDDYYKFTFIRNKYSLLVSNWHYDNKKLKVTFKQFIKDIVVPNKDIYDFWIDQYYLTVADNQQIFDFIGRQENFQEDIKIPFAKIGIRNYDANKRTNSGKYNTKLHYSTYYDEELKGLVDEKFKQEIEHFNFKMR